MALVDSITALGRGSPDAGDPTAAIERLKNKLSPAIADALQDVTPETADRSDLSRRIRDTVLQSTKKQGLKLTLLQERNLVTALLNDWLRASQTTGPEMQPAGRDKSKKLVRRETAGALESQERQPANEEVVDSDATIDSLLGDTSYQPSSHTGTTSRTSVESAVDKVRPVLTDQIDVAAAAKMPRAELARQISELVGDILRDRQIQLNSMEQRDLVTILVNDMLGLGPLESLLEDERVTDILVNGPHQTYVERGGKLELADIHFRDNAHLLSICTRIVSRIGRRVDESSPMCDARLADGSRVNIIIPPLALDGPSISIRKFSEKKITLEVMTRQGNISKNMETVLKIASRSRLNILISGGTGSGKTTLLNALSRLIDTGERIVTIEDAAELQLQQPHVVRLETRPPNLEGRGEVTMRDLVKNSLRMRPDRIILGEVRSSEALDMLQAMNTGHEGSMCTVHANNPREALTRLENMVSMTASNLPAKALRTQIASAIDVIVQISRMRDGMRRVTSIAEVVGMEGEVITTQELFRYKYEGEDQTGKLLGTFEPAGVRPHFAEKASYFNLERPLLEAIA
ncbi:MAG: CpaF family protein [Alphaproteobacteria bacterium]